MKAVGNDEDGKSNFELESALLLNGSLVSHFDVSSLTCSLMCKFLLPLKLMLSLQML